MKFIQRLVRKHLKINDARVKCFAMMYDRMATSLPVHVNLVGAGRGLDKLNDAQRTAAGERASIELYCRNTASDTCAMVRNMTSSSFHKYLRDNLSRVQSLLNSKLSIHPIIKRRLLIDKLFEIRREYNMKRLEAIKLEEATYKFPEITPSEANHFIKSGFIDEDPVIRRLLSKLGPLALVGKECLVANRESTLHTFIKNVMEELHIEHGDAFAKFNALVHSLRSYDAMIRKQNEKHILCYQVFTPEVCLEAMLRVHEKTMEHNKKENLLQQQLQVEQFKQEKYDLILQMQGHL